MGGGGSELEALRGFTLAEVLITLGIIGIVAALTMPSLVANYQEKAIVTKLKKFYSAISQAYLHAAAEYGDPTNWDLITNGNIQGAQNMAEKFKPYLKVVSETSSGSWYYYDLADGSRIGFIVRSADCSDDRGPGELAMTCGVISYESAAKEILKSRLDFNLTKNAVIPKGMPEHTGDASGAHMCLQRGYLDACTGWVLYNENLDFLHCSNLSWDGPTKCD